MKILRDDGNLRYLSLEDESIIVIALDDDGSSINVRTSEGDMIGSISLAEQDNGSFLITSLFLDKKGAGYKRRGIGREALRFHREFFRSAICAADNDGRRRPDGAHLTGDAV